MNTKIHFFVLPVLSSIILFHNHLSDKIHPSDAGQKITKMIRDCGTMLNIAVLDHLIVEDDKYYSFAEGGYLYSERISEIKNYRIDLRNFNDGLYFLTIHTNGHTFVKKLCKFGG